MKIYNYQFFSTDLLRLDSSNGHSVWVKLDADSGRIVTRLKRNTISNVQHPGIWLGCEYQSGTPLVIHNHYLQGGAHISTFDAYAVGQNVNWIDGVCRNDWQTVLKIGLNHVISGKQYRALDYNCQTFTNTACHNQSRSESVEMWGKIALGVLAFIAIAKAA